MRKPYSSVFWLHLAIQFILYLSWFLFSWQVVLIGIGILHLQYIFLGGCLLSKKEFGNDRTTCTLFYLTRWGLLKSTRKWELFFKYYISAIGIGAALVWQVALGFEPLLF